MTNQRPIANILADIQQLIADMTEHDEVLYLATELAHQLRDEVLVAIEENDLDIEDAHNQDD